MEGGADYAGARRAPSLDGLEGLDASDALDARHPQLPSPSPPSSLSVSLQGAPPKYLQNNKSTGARWLEWLSDSSGFETET
jgi:hypothetical protein